jgi:hypothetical protein
VNTYKLDCGHLAVSESDDLTEGPLSCLVCGIPRGVLEMVSKPRVVPDYGAPTVMRSYGCSFGCGNPYDYIIVQVVDGTTEFACLPCFVKLATDMVTAVTEGISPEAMAELRAMEAQGQAPMTSGSVRRRGKNAPADADDPDLVEAFDSRIMSDELSEEFK